jgi:hypothetical protein
MNAGSATMKGESLWPRLAGLSLVIEMVRRGSTVRVRQRALQKRTSERQLRRRFKAAVGLSPKTLERVLRFQRFLALVHTGGWSRLGLARPLSHWPEPPEWEGALRFRQWAFESAALDLALRQAGHSLHDVLGLEPQPVRFVNSLGLGKEPSIEPVRRRLARSPGVRFKLDAEATWRLALADEVAATGAVDTIDFKGQYGFEVTSSFRCPVVDASQARPPNVHALT